MVETEENQNELKPEGKIWFFVILVFVLFSGALTFFAGRNSGMDNFNQAQISSKSPARQARLYTVYYNTGVFSPTNIRIHVGDTVKFENNGQESIQVVSDKDDGATALTGFDSMADIPPNSSFSFTFTKQGAFGYHNLYSESERGTVIVRP